MIMNTKCHIVGHETFKILSTTLFIVVVSSVYQLCYGFDCAALPREPYSILCYLIGAVEVVL